MFNLSSILELIAIALFIGAWILIGMSMIAYEKRMGRWDAKVSAILYIFCVPLSFVGFLYERDLDRRFPNTPMNRQR